MVVVPKEAVAVLEKVPDNEDVQRQDNQQRHRMAGASLLVRGGMHQFIDFDRTEESRVADGQQPGSAYTEDQSKPLREADQAIDQHPRRRTEDIALCQMADL